MRISFNLTEDDYLTYSNYHYAHTPSGRAGMYRMYVIGVVLFAMFAYSQYDDATYGAQNPLFYAFYLLTSGIILGAIYYTYIQVVRPSIIRWASKTSSFREMLGAQELKWDSESVEIIKESGRGKIAWSDVVDVAEDKRHFYLILAPMRAFIVPKSAFKSAEEAQAAYQEARNYFEQAKGKK